MLKKIEALVLGFSIIAITGVMIFNVIMRYIFNSSWTPTEEVCLILIILVTFIGSSYAARRGNHLFASILFDIPLINFRVKKIIAIFIALANTGLSIVIVYLGGKYVISNYLSARFTPALGIPFYLFYWVVPLGFMSMGIQNVRIIQKNFKENGYSLSPDGEARQS
jgi:TRAP-type C4-dicarboxylate transport system permease small subunit